MKKPKKEKDFDAVKMMREIRDQLSQEIKEMTYAEEKAYLKKLLAKNQSQSKGETNVRRSIR